MCDRDSLPSPEMKYNEDLSQPIPELEPDPIPGPSGTVSVPSVVVVPPNTVSSPDSVSSVSSAIDSVPPETEELDTELLEILGSDCAIEKTYGKDIQKDLASRLQHWATTGLTKEARKELKEKYLTPGNCRLIDAPDMNAEIKAAVSDDLAKRDKAIFIKQQQVTSAITCLGEAITLLLQGKEKNITLLKMLTNAARIMSDCQYSFSTTRRNLLLGAVKRDVRDQLKNTKIDMYIFGEKLPDALKSTKAISKSNSDIKVTAPKPQQKKPPQSTTNSSRHLNWKGLGPFRRLTGPTQTKESAMKLTGGPVASSSKQSQHPQQRQNYNRR